MPTAEEIQQTPRDWPLSRKVTAIMRAEDEALGIQEPRNPLDVETSKEVKWGFAVDSRNKQPDETDAEFAARAERERTEGAENVNEDMIGEPKTVGGGDDEAVVADDSRKQTNEQNELAEQRRIEKERRQRESQSGR